VALAIAAAAAGVMPVFLTGALAVQLEAGLHVNATAIGGAVATFFGTSALSSVRAGKLAERVGSWQVMLAAIGLAVASLLGAGLATVDLPVLLVSLGIGGLSNGAMQPAVNLLLSRAVSDHRQGLAFGIKQAAIPSATLLSGLAVPALALTLGWRAAYLAATGLVLLVGAVLASAGRQLVPGASTRPGTTTRDTSTRSAMPDPTRAGPVPTPRSGGLAAARGFDPRPLVPLAAAMACAVAASNAMGAFVVSGAVHDGVSPGLAGVLSAAGSAVGLSARVGFGWRADRSGVRGRQASLAHLGTVGRLIAVGALGYACLATGTLPLLVPGVLVAYGAGWGYNGLFNLAVVRAYPENPARATGVTQVGTYVGGMVGPLGFGLVADHLGFHVAWALCAALAVVAVVAFGAGRRHLGRAPSGVAGEDRRSLPRPGATRSPQPDRRVGPWRTVLDIGGLGIGGTRGSCGAALRLAGPTGWSGRWRSWWSAGWPRSWLWSASGWSSRGDRKRS
jgi:MFS family permease